MWPLRLTPWSSLMQKRNRSWRKHHESRLKKKRIHYHNAGDGSAVAIGYCYQTPCLCSCWMCGNQRKHHGMNMQERRARTRNTD
ncbi:hypothetical protein CTN06_06450 [Pectobacterium zantedeschiae]|uniref:Uncharacterized protein n=1 Tax=Pectobacterium zantedeschiae TaxID=2034769 RepID=A0A9X8JHI5_9GAMM|nr:hypothetical protein CLR69_01170 [Pectobacterium zantedeschiae]RYC49082.1 hypothetical protein CTN06_06450 [Pectobacterium zantedeschiae]